MIENSAHQISEADGAYTRITRNDMGKIVQLDTYVPEITEGEHFVGVDFPALQQAYPDARLGHVDQWANENRGSIAGIYAHTVITNSPLAIETNITENNGGIHVDVAFHPEHIVAPADVFAMDGEGIAINQRMGVVRPGAFVSAVVIDRAPES